MKRILPIVLCLSLGACMTAGKRGGGTPVATYDFGPPAERRAASPGIPAAALDIRAPHWLDTAGIQYRLAYAESGRLREYAQARWVAAPSALLQQRLGQTLGVMPLGQGAALCVLRVELDDFSQVFTSPTESHAVLAGRAVMLDRSRGVLAELPVQFRSTASSADAQGGVAALSATVAQLGDSLIRWRTELTGNGLLRTCTSQEKGH